MKFSMGDTGADSINQGIGNVFKALAQAPYLQQQAEMQAALQNAQAYHANMSGNKAGAEAESERFTLDNRKGVDAEIAANPDMPVSQRLAAWAFRNVGPKNIKDFASGMGEFQSQDFRNQAAENVDNLDKMNRYNTLAKPGETYMPFDNIGNTGTVFNKATGDGKVASAVLQNLFSNESNAKANENNAQAAKSYSGINVDNANIKKINAQTGKVNAGAMPTQIGTDANGEPVYGIAPTGKPLPAASLKLQQEELDAIGTASATQADLSAIENQIKAGKLDFGVLSNLRNRGKNLVGMSDEESRNFSSFRANLEKMRNDSLRLNKGVQTDGDAQRAWNELFENINDKNVVLQRINEIKRINARAVNLRKMNVDVIRANYGNAPLDVSGYTNTAPALGAPSAASGGGAGGLTPAEAAELAHLRQRFGR